MPAPSRPDPNQAAGVPDTGRRGLLKGALAGAAALGAGRAAAAAPGKKSAPPPKLPHIKLGPHSVSRLICGANPFNGGSHLSGFVDREMKAYYTPEQILKTLRRCQEAGINCWQGGVGNCDLYQRFRAEGGTMHHIAIASGGAASVKTLAQAGTIAVAHHGETTDGLFKSGKLDQARDYLKRVRDAGMAVGVSTHMPDVVDAIESKAWDVDYYMTCVYERHRSAEELKKLLGRVPIPVREVYLTEDPPRMFKAVRQTAKPCLAFKILAAGRLSDRRQWVEAAFRETYASIKPTDGVIIGIYDRYSDQVAENAAFVRKYGMPKES